MKFIGDRKSVFYQALGERIKRAREQAQVTQDQLADAVELSRTSITNIERGRQGVQVYMLVNIAEKLGRNVVDLIPLDGLRERKSLPEELAEKTGDKEKLEWAKRVIGLDSEDDSHGT